VLEGDIPSAMNPPPGCPFQTRCRYKHLVPGGLCETQVPPLKNLGGGHKSLCWLPDDVLAAMEPVIKVGRSGSDPATGMPHVSSSAIAKASREKAQGEADATPARAIKSKAEAAQPARRASAKAGEEGPVKTQAKVGQGRQAASAKVKPASAKTPKEAAAVKGKVGKVPPARPTVSSPAAAKAQMGIKPATKGGKPKK